MDRSPSHRRWVVVATALAAAWLVPFVGGCARSVPYRLEGQPGVYTLTNLHPDEVHARLYSVDYQQEGLIPVCTPVLIERVTSKEAVFVRQDTGKRYQYLFHSTMKLPIAQHLDRYFGTQCPKQLLSTLQGVDAQGVREGQVMKGMSKGAVVLAIGYPPPHATPTLDANVWKYWKNRWDTFDVYFENGRVSRIQD